MCKDKRTNTRYMVQGKYRAFMNVQTSLNDKPNGRNVQVFTHLFAVKTETLLDFLNLPCMSTAFTSSHSTSSANMEQRSSICNSADSTHCGVHIILMNFVMSKCLATSVQALFVLAVIVAHEICITVTV